MIFYKYNSKTLLEYILIIKILINLMEDYHTVLYLASSIKPPDPTIWLFLPVNGILPPNDSNWRCLAEALKNIGKETL